MSRRRTSYAVAVGLVVAGMTAAIPAVAAPVERPTTAAASAPTATAPPGWAPRGKIVADSGFRPNPNGFAWENYGATTPDGKPAVGMSSAELRQLYGDGVCASTDGLTPGGPCQLTPPADYFLQWLSEGSNGGHCFGMAEAASLGFHGALAPTITRSVPAIKVKLTDSVQRLVSRYFSSQWTMGTPPSLTPAQVVSLLRKNLKRGTAPYILGIQQLGPDGRPTGGHAITPYALYDRGKGLFDIAVYDNNWPNMARAVHVDTVRNTWEYLAATNPKQASAMYKGNARTKTMTLMSVARAAAQQPCPVCEAGVGGGVLVGFDPVHAENYGRIDVRLLDANLQPLSTSLYRQLPQLTPSTEDLAPMPAFQVQTGVPFIVKIDGTEAVVPEEQLNVYAVAAGAVRVAQIDGFGPGVTDMVGVDPVTLEFAVGGATPSPTLIDAHQEGDAYFYFAGRRTLSPGTVLDLDLDEQRRRVVIASDDRAPGIANVAALRQVGDVSVAYLTRGVTVGAGDQLVVTYDTWTSTEGAPQLWYDLGGDGVLDQQLPFPQTDLAQQTRAKGGATLVGTHLYPAL